MNVYTYTGVLEDLSKDAAKVTIHDYESVRNRATNIHDAIHDWLEVDRVTGKVTITLFK